MKLHVVRTIATRTATAVGAAVISAVVVASSLSVAQAATEAIAPDSVTSRMIRDGAVKSVDIKDGAILGADVKDGTVTGVDIADGSISSVDVDASVGQPRVSVFVDGAATVGQFTTERATGVESVTNPNSGLFCITPVAGVDVDSVVPIVSRTFSGTAFPFETTVGWTAFPFECPSTSIAVFSTTADFSVNDVGFTVVIP